MNDQLDKLRVKDFLQRLEEWAKNEPELLALALVGSHARGDANAGSDVDLVLLLRNQEKYLKDRNWILKFGSPANIVEEDWGKVTSLRVFYSTGMEVEFGLTDLEWGADPADKGDARVIRDGLIILYEKDGHLSKKLVRFSTWPRVSWTVDKNSDIRNGYEP